ncbi:uncharacterized protein LOC135838571 [Planococcus citri]|uniref:uncharacterized protein LOC135838571 n=1 Tax=Planococcus citri TaxID=170843 RepID=UPI0031F8333D
MSLKTSENTPEILLPPIAPFVSQNSTTQSTTSAPTSPTEDPCLKPATEGHISDHELEMLKDHIRVLRGLQTPATPTKKPSSAVCKKPRIIPRSNQTSRIRIEAKKCWLMRRCGDFIKPDGDKALTPEKQRCLLNKAKHLTAEEIFVEQQRAEADYLKYLASRARTDKGFRSNRASEFRFKHMRGEPILSSYYEDAYDYHEKPPFFVAHRYKPLPVWKLPRIDKDKETWFVPQNDDGDLPLYVIPKEEQKKKGKRKPLKRKHGHKRVPRPTKSKLVTVVTKKSDKLPYVTRKNRGPSKPLTM